MQKHQLVFIHGGMTFKNKKDYLSFLKNRKISVKDRVKWFEAYLDEELGNRFDIIRPSMPLKENANYIDWKIHFEKFLPYMRKNVILIGSSLGGIFLAKYLSENKFPKKILSLYLIAPPYDNSLPGEDLAGGFKLKSNLDLISVNTRNIYLLSSKDDKVVPLNHAKKYAKKLKNAKMVIFTGKNGHFKIPRFPEIIKMIKDDLNKSKRR